MKEFQVVLPLARPLLFLLSFGSPLITLFHVFHGNPLGKLSLTLKDPQLLDQAFFFIVSRGRNHCSLLILETFSQAT